MSVMLNILAAWSARWYSGLPKPEMQALVGPNCDAPYKPGVKLRVGMVKEILLNLLESKDKAVNNLFRFSRTNSELDDWIDYIKDYVITASFKPWKESNEKFVRDTWGGIQSQQKGKPDASQTPEKESNREISIVTQIEEMFNSGELVKLLDEMKLELEEKIAVLTFKG